MTRKARREESVTRSHRITSAARWLRFGREYRERNENRRQVLEDLVLENQVLRERIDIARSLGATDEELAPIIRRLGVEPLPQLDLVGAKGMLPPPEDRADRPDADSPD
jgi:hypothetical protein